MPEPEAKKSKKNKATYDLLLSLVNGDFPMHLLMLQGINMPNIVSLLLFIVVAKSMPAKKRKAEIEKLAHHINSSSAYNFFNSESLPEKFKEKTYVRSLYLVIAAHRTEQWPVLAYSLITRPVIGTVVRAFIHFLTFSNRLLVRCIESCENIARDIRNNLQPGPTAPRLAYASVLNGKKESAPVEMAVLNGPLPSTTR